MTTLQLSERRTDLDRARGLAVLLMFLDHAAVVALHVYNVGGSPGGVLMMLRLTVTRASVIIFGLLVGFWLDSHRSHVRTLQVAAAGVFCTVLGALVGLPIGRPDVLLIIALVLACRTVVLRYPVAVIAVSLLQVTTWPVPWSGYQPGVLFGLAAAGVWWAERDDLLELEVVTWTDELPKWLAWPGRHALELYVAHIALLALVVLGA